MFSRRNTFAQSLTVTIAVFAVITAAALALLNVIDRTSAGAEEELVRNAVRSDDTQGAVSVEEIDGVDVLRIAYDYDGSRYDKYIYCFDGSLRELFTSAEMSFDPASGERICDAEHMDLVLMTGPAGSGKSTTLAAMVDRINSRRTGHVITIEDPIEYLHPHKNRW